MASRNFSMGIKTTLFTLASLALAAGAYADITIVEGAFAVNPENTQFNDPGLILTGPVVEGAGSTTGTIIEFFNAGEDLAAIAAGAARVSGLDGHFTNLSIQLQDPLMAFVEIEFNLIALGNADVTITAHSTKGGTTIESFGVSSNGNNRFTVSSTLPDHITLVEIASTVNLQDIRQIRFEGVQVVPEPATFIALGAGVLLLAARKRRRN